MSSEASSQRIAKFDGSDFAFWKTQIEDYLYQKDLYRPLLGKEKGMKKTEETDDWEVLDRRRWESYACRSQNLSHTTL